MENLVNFEQDSDQICSLSDEVHQTVFHFFAAASGMTDVYIDDLRPGRFKQLFSVKARMWRIW